MSEGRGQQHDHRQQVLLPLLLLGLAPALSTSPAQGQEPDVGVIAMLRQQSAPVTFSKHTACFGQHNARGGSPSPPRTKLTRRYGLTPNFLLLVSILLGVVTVTGPVVAPFGTVAVM